MTGLYILLGFLALLGLLMLIRLRVEVAYKDDEFRLLVRALFIKLDVMKLIASRGQKEQEEQQPAKKPDEAQQGILKKLSKLREQLELYLYLLPPLWSRLIRRIVIRKLHIRLQISREDAYDTAMAYGAASAALNTLYGLLSSIFTLKDPLLDLRPVFVPGNSAFEAEAILSLRIFHIFAAGSAILIRYVRHSLRKRRELKAKVV